MGEWIPLRLLRLVEHLAVLINRFEKSALVFRWSKLINIGATTRRLEGRGRHTYIVLTASLLMSLVILINDDPLSLIYILRKIACEGSWRICDKYHSAISPSVEYGDIGHRATFVSLL